MRRKFKFKDEEKKLLKFKNQNTITFFLWDNERVLVLKRVGGSERKFEPMALLMCNSDSN